MRTSFYRSGKQVAVGEISSLPGSSQVAVLHSAFVLPRFRGQGIGAEAHQDRLMIAQDLLYDAAICTVEMTNYPQLKNLSANGWKCAHEFVSSKTGHTIGIFIKTLR